jgi:hypothetical protein
MTELKLSRRDSLKGLAGLGAATVAVAAGATALTTSEAAAAQAHMDVALETLNTALHQLENAVPDKGGYRVKAIAAVRSAIHDVESGIRWAKTH